MALAHFLAWHMEHTWLSPELCPVGICRLLQRYHTFLVCPTSWVLHNNLDFTFKTTWLIFSKFRNWDNGLVCISWPSRLSLKTLVQALCPWLVSSSMVSCIIGLCDELYKHVFVNAYAHGASGNVPHLWSDTRGRPYTSDWWRFQEIISISGCNWQWFWRSRKTSQK